jgi:hypothetical protein
MAGTPGEQFEALSTRLLLKPQQAKQYEADTKEMEESDYRKNRMDGA